MQTKLNFTALITETKDKPTTPSVVNRVDAFVMFSTPHTLANQPKTQYVAKNQKR